MSGDGRTGLCACEGVAHGEMGPVADPERLARIIVSPRHLRSGGRVSPGAFPRSHLAGTGLSLVRVDRIDGPELVQQANAIAGDQTAIGAMLCRALDVRAVPDDSHPRSLCVVDDPVTDDPHLPDNPAHAIAVRSADQTDDEIARIQLELIRRFGQVVPLSAVHVEESHSG